MDETLLIDQAQAGDRNALNELVALFWHPVYRFISYKTSNPEDAKEITQETFIKALRALPNYHQSNATFGAYLNHIAHNLLIDFWRKKGRTPLMVDLTECEQPTADDTHQPDVQAISREMRENIASVLQELPNDQQKTIEFRIISGFSLKETAIALGKSEAAIKMLQQRALKNLRTLLLDRGIIENHIGGGKPNA